MATKVDGRGQPAQAYRHASKSITFDGSAGFGLAGTNITMFTVTGEVEILRIVPFCTTLLTESGATATLSLGLTGSVAFFIAATNAVDIDANEFWVDTAPDPIGIAIPAGLKEIAITDDILLAPAVTNVASGVLRIDVWWRPLSVNGNLVAA